MSASPFSDFIIFADETGDHGLVSIDEQFPVFALAFCILRKDDYVDTIVPAMQRLKMAVWGHDQIIFHEHDIRKEKGPFGLLRTDPSLRAWLMDELSRLVAEAPMQLVVSIIDKKQLTQKYSNPYNPYEIAMLFCMERTLGYLLGQGQTGRRVTVAFESRGKREDAELELEFRRICDNQGNWGYKQTNFQEIAFEHLFVDKKSNTAGLQLADLVARPLALRYLRPAQPNRAAEIIQGKVLRCKRFP